MKTGVHKIYLIAIIVLAVFIRFAGISSRPIWYDESFSILLSEQGPSAILSGTLSVDADNSAAEEHPPAYYFALWGWMKIFGNSIPAARALSILASLASVYLIYKIVQQLFDEKTALLAAFIASILPFQIHYAQEIRMYAPLEFWLLLTTYAFLKRQWILFTVAAALAQYTHNLAAFYLISLALTPVFQRDWKMLRALTLSGLAALVLYSPWLIQLPAQFAKVTTNFWIEKPGAEKFFTLILFYLPHLPLEGLQLPIGLSLALLVIALAAYQTLRARINPEERVKGLWAAYLAFFPPLLIWLVSQWKPVYLERAFLPSHALFCVWLAWALIRTNLPRALFSFMVLLIVFSAGIGIYQHVTYTGFPYAPFRQVTQRLRENLRNDDAIIHANKNTRLPAELYAPDLPQEYIADPSGTNIDTLSPATQRTLNLIAQPSIEVAAQDATRVWFIVFQRHVDRYKELGFEDHPYLIYLSKNFKLENMEQRDDLQIYLFTKQSGK